MVTGSFCGKKVTWIMEVSAGGMWTVWNSFHNFQPLTVGLLNVAGHGPIHDLDPSLIFIDSGDNWSPPGVNFFKVLVVRAVGPSKLGPAWLCTQRFRQQRNNVAAEKWHWQIHRIHQKRTQAGGEVGEVGGRCSQKSMTRKMGKLKHLNHPSTWIKYDKVLKFLIFRRFSMVFNHE